MSEYANKSNRGRMVSLVFAMQGAGLIVGPLLAIGLLSAGMSHDLVWRLLLGFGAIPALSVFYLRRQLNETPRFQLAQMEAKDVDQKAKEQGRATGMRGVLADRRLLRWLIGASVAWFLFDLVYYGNTISSPIIVKLVARPARLFPRRMDHRPSWPEAYADRRVRHDRPCLLLFVAHPWGHDHCGSLPRPVRCDLLLQ
jgi:MFS family permease